MGSNLVGRGCKVRGNLQAGALLVASLMLSACSSAPPATYDLTAAPATGRATPRAQMIVTEPSSFALYDSERLVVRTVNGVAYLPGAQWADRLPRLLQSRLIQSFENAHGTGAVGRSSDRFAARYLLASEIRRFDVRTDSGDAEVEISAKLVADGSGKIVAGKIFSAKAPVGAINGENAVLGLDAATQAVFAQIVVWASQHR